VLLSEHLDLATRHVRYLKERACRKGPADIYPTVAAYRGGDLICLSTIGSEDFRTDFLAAVSVSSFGFDADVIAASFETVQSRPWRGDAESGEINPMTMQPWRMGEIQDALANHDAAAKGWATEALGAMVGNRAGDVLMTHMPYGYAGKKQQLYWREGQARMMNAGGLIADLMRKAMLSTSGGALIPETADFGRDDRDLYTARMLQAKIKNAAVMLMVLEGDSPEREAKLSQAGAVMDWRKKRFD
jgi:nitroreductase